MEEGIHIRKEDTKFLYEVVLEKASAWGTPDNLMFVVGATQVDEFLNIRKITPHHFYLVPGVGVQGGSLKEISEKALIKTQEKAKIIAKDTSFRDLVKM